MNDPTDSRGDPVREVRKHLEQALALLEMLRAGTPTLPGPDVGADQ